MRQTSRAFLVRIACVLALLAAAHAADAKTFTWKATGKGGTIYLMGSIHLMPASFYPLDPALEAAFKDSDLLVEEVDLAEMLDPMAQMAMLTRGMLPSNQSLDTLLSPATLALVKKATGEMGAAGGPLMRFKPWMLAIALQGMELAKSGFDPSLGLDQHFYDQAKDAGKAVQGLETVEFQISRFDGMTMEQQDRFLAETLKELATETATVGKLGDAWKTGDVAAVERVALTDLKSDPVMYQRLLVERNKNWMPKIEALFARRGRALVIVGAAHLIGPDGLLAMLKAKGYTVEQL
ncbi:MAG: hypothetical protein JWL71_1664 [Acidobacteria bacterium]|nr:hypothetical protein [Acidobacteriota bacterium]